MASPRTWDPELCKLALSLAALQEATKTKKLGKLENRSITGTSFWPPSCAELGVVEEDEESLPNRVGGGDLSR